MTQALVKPDLPSNIALLDAEMLEENSFRKLQPSGNKIQKQQLGLAKGAETCLRKKNDEQLWQDTFEATESATVEFDESEIAHRVKQHFEEMTDSKAANCLLSCNCAKWAKTVQQLWFKKCGSDGGQLKTYLAKSLN